MKISFTKNRYSKGFTLVEMLVVTAIISMLSSVVSATFNAAVKSTNVARTKNELMTINLAMERFFADHDDYPPIGDDHNSATTLNPNLPPEWALGTWEDVATLLDTENYGSKIPRVDPWGTPYGYDKNYKQYYFPAWSVICSAGPNKVLETATGRTDSETIGDDICISFPDKD